MSTELSRIGESAEWLIEEPYVWEIRLSGSVRGRGTTVAIAMGGPGLLDNNGMIDW